LRHITSAGVLLAALALASCGPEPPLVIGRPGRTPGEFDQPRALAASRHGLAVVDRSGRLQMFDLDGTFAGEFDVQDPTIRRGFPCGVTWLPDGTLAVADTHRSTVTFFDREGTVVSHFGELGAGPGQFIYPQRIDVAPDGRLAVTEYGVSTGNRAQVFTADGQFLRTFGGPDAKDGGLGRPMGIVRMDDDSYVVADQLAGLQRFGPGGASLGRFAPEAVADGSMPYGLTRNPEGDLFVACMAEHSLVRISPAGRLLGRFGGPGADPGLFREPWDVAWHAGYLYVADRMNHRVQRFDVAEMEWTLP